MLAAWFSGACAGAIQTTTYMPALMKHRRHTCRLPPGPGKSGVGRVHGECSFRATFHANFMRIKTDAALVVQMREILFTADHPANREHSPTREHAVREQRLLSLPLRKTISNAYEAVDASSHLAQDPGPTSDASLCA